MNVAELKEKRRQQRRRRTTRRTLWTGSLMVVIIAAILVWTIPLEQLVPDSTGEDTYGKQQESDSGEEAKGGKNIEASEPKEARDEAQGVDVSVPVAQLNSSLREQWRGCQGERHIPQRRVCFSSIVLKEPKLQLCQVLDADTRAACLGTLYSRGIYGSEAKRNRSGNVSALCPADEACHMGYGFGANSTAPCEDIENEFYRDNCRFGVSIRRKDPSLCEGLQMQDFCYWYLARDTMNSSLCLKAGSWEEDCLFRFAVKDSSVKGVTKEICDDLPAQQKPVCYAMQEEDPQFCNMSDKWSPECYTRLAVGTQNVSLCEKAGEKTEYCKWSVALNTRNESICAQLDDKRKLCYMDVAMKKDEPQLCNASGRYAENCRFQVMLDKDVSPAVCEKLSNSEQCYFYMAQRRDQPAVCEKSGRYRDYCYSLMAKQLGAKRLCDESGRYEDACLMEVAVATSNTSLCSRSDYTEECVYSVVEQAVDADRLSQDSCAQAGALQDACYFELAAKLENLNICDKAGSLEQECRARKKHINETDEPLPQHLITHQDDPLKPKEGSIQ